MLMGAKPDGARPVLRSDMGWQHRHDLYVSALRDNGFTQSMSRKGNCIDNGATEQVFGHLKDEFFRGGLGDVRGVQGRPRGVHSPLEPRETPEHAEGPDPGRVPGAGTSRGRLAVLINASKFWAQFICGPKGRVPCAGAC